MVNRIIVTDTDDVRVKIFATTAPLFQGDKKLPEGAITSDDNLLVTETEEYKAGELGDVVENITRLAAVRSVEAISEWEIAVRLSPAFFWSDKEGEISLLQRVLQIFLDYHFQGHDVEVLHDGGQPCIAVHTGNQNSKLFICDRPITASYGDHTFKKKDANGSVSANNNDTAANNIARAILLNPSVISVTINGKQMHVVGGYWAGSYSYDNAIGEKIVDYITGVLHVNLYPNEPVQIKQRVSE